MHLERLVEWNIELRLVTEWTALREERPITMGPTIRILIVAVILHGLTSTKSRAQDTTVPEPSVQVDVETIVVSPVFGIPDDVINMTDHGSVEPGHRDTPSVATRISVLSTKVVARRGQAIVGFPEIGILAVVVPARDR